MTDYELHMIKEKAVYSGYRRNDGKDIILNLIAQIIQLKSSSLIGGVNVRTKKMG